MLVNNSNHTHIVCACMCVCARASVNKPIYSFTYNCSKIYGQLSIHTLQMVINLSPTVFHEHTHVKSNNIYFVLCTTTLDRAD